MNEDILVVIIFAVAFAGFGILLALVAIPFFFKRKAGTGEVQKGESADYTLNGLKRK